MYGVHRNGVANCNMCHVMHNSQDGSIVDPTSPGGNQWLLVRDTPSDVCLMCHSGVMGNVFGTDPLNPPREVGGGNFCFLLEDNLNDGYGGASHPIPGDDAGHNLVAPSFNMGPDATLDTAPGGTFPSEHLGCTSCHDPHGNQNFRMLNGVGWVQNELSEFVNPAPEAYGLSIYHGQERANRHTAYYNGVSAWCGNCHPDIHAAGSDHVHVTGEPIGEDVATYYNAYDGTLDILGGDQMTAYLPEVPFEDPTIQYTSTSGPTGASRVMCLTCHRAHASSAPNAGRWDFNLTHVSDDGQESGSYAIPNPYAEPAQRSLCNKCHRKDEFDAVP